MAAAPDAATDAVNDMVRDVRIEVLEELLEMSERGVEITSDSLCKMLAELKSKNV